MARVPTMTEGWQSGHISVDGKDLRSNTTYMWGGILASTEIRISTEFDSADSMTSGIQEAIDDLPATGGTVLIPAGTHEISYHILVGTDSVKLVGVGSSSIIRIADGRNSTLTALALAAQADIVVLDGTQFNVGDWICIKDMAPAANSVETRVIDAIVGDTITVSVDLAFNHAIDTEVWTSHPTLLTEATVTGLRISNLRINGNRANQMEGILGEIFDAAAANQSNLPLPTSIEAWGTVILWDTSDVVIKNVDMDNMPAHGIFIWGSTQNVTNVTIRDCYLNDIADKGIVALQLAGATPVYIKIEDNLIFDCGVGVRHLPSAAVNYGDGINFHVPTGTHLTVRGNIIKEWRRSGIAIDGSQYNVIDDNIIGCDGNLLGGNAGILYENSDNVTLSNNEVYINLSPKSTALSIWDCTDMTIIGGSYTIPDGGVNGASVLSLADVGGARPTDITIVGVTIEANNGVITDPKTLYPLSIVESDFITVAECIIKSAGVGRPGVRIQDSNKCNIHDNEIFDDARKMTYGIALDATSDRNYIHHNRLEDYITAPIDDNGADNLFESNLRNYLSNTNVENVTVQADVAQANVTVADGTSFFVGQGVIISDGSPQSEHCNIGSIAANVLTMDENLVNTYLLADTPVLTGKDTAGIQESINNLPAIGGVVNIPVRTNTISSSIIVNKPCIIQGEGDGSLVYLDDNINVDMFILPADQTDVIIRDFKMDGNYANNATAGRGIYCTDGNLDCLFENLEITGTRDQGIHVARTGTNPARIKILNNHIIDCQPDATFGAAGIDLNTIDDSIVAHNTVEGCGDVGITISNGTGTLIDDNIIDGNTRFGMYLTGTLAHITITDNVCRSNGGIGIYVDGNVIRGLSISDNTCELNDGGITVYRTDGVDTIMDHNVTR